MSSNQDTPNNSAAMPAESHRKFQKDGTPKLFPGISVLCHLRNTNPTQSTLRAAMIKHLPHITHINKTEPPGPSHVELPKSSWHMTIYDTKVYDPATWTSDEGMSAQDARNADLPTYHSKFSAIEADFEHLLPIRLKISPTRHPGNGDPLVVPVIPYALEETEKLAFIRRTVAKAFDRPRPDRYYKFHVSTHYQLRGMGDSEFWGLRGEWVDGVENIAEELREGFEIDAVELCSFDDMFRFDVVDSVGIGVDDEAGSNIQAV